MTESWRPVVGWEGIYEVSDRGRVKSLERQVQVKPGLFRKNSERILKQGHARGYLRVVLSRNGETSPRSVHHLVLESFVGARPEGKVVRHLDGDKENNSLQNLRYGTPAENSQDTIRHGRNHSINRKKCPRGHLLEAPNLTSSGMKRGHRSCLACSRAHGYSRYFPEQKERFQELSDEYYSKILSEPEVEP